MATPTVENYLKAMLSLEREGSEVGVSDLSETLGVSKPTAHSMVKKLAEREWIVYERYRPLRLTESGRREAGLVVRRHRLTEMFLVEKMGFGWEEVHPIAEQIEHIKSAKFFERMDELLGSPTLDPHGSPIPDRQGKVGTRVGQPLTEVSPPAEVRLLGLADSSAALLEFLNQKTITLGSELQLNSVEPYDSSLTISYAGQDISLTADTARQLLVIPI